MLPDGWPVRRVGGTKFESFKLVDVIRFSTDIIVTGCMFFGPFFQHRPVSALAYLSDCTLGGLCDGGVTRCVIGLAQYVAAQGIHAVGDVHERQGLPHALMVFSDGSMDVFLEEILGWIM